MYCNRLKLIILNFKLIYKRNNCLNFYKINLKNSKILNKNLTMFACLKHKQSEEITIEAKPVEI